MRLPSGKRLGQSGYELALAIFFTFFIHAAVVAAALFLSIAAIPKKILPPVYQVKLVALPQEPAPAPLPTAPVEPTPPPPPPPQETKKKTPASPKAGKRAVKAPKAAPKQNTVPELAPQKPKPAEILPPPVATPEVQPQPPAKASEDKAAPSSGGGADNVSLPTPQQDFKFPYYLQIVKNQIGQHWRPPPDAKDAKARVIFTINRAGRVVDINIDANPAHTNGTAEFQRAAERAIRESKNFPPLPEDFSKKEVEFTVDLMAE